jgi:hypothetical protein
MKIPRLPLCKEIDRRSVETLVTRTYFQLVLASWDEHKTRTAILTKHGNCEVRLVEILPADADDALDLWIELVVGNVSIDSHGCDDLEAAALAAEYLISQAIELYAQVNDAARPDASNSDARIDTEN